MNPTQKNNEAKQEKLNPLRRVEEMVSENQAKEKDRGMAEVMGEVDRVKGGVADVMAGMEAPSEGISERNREDKRGDFRGAGTTAQSDDDQSAAAQVRSGLLRGLPTQEVMIRKVRTAINLQIAKEEKKAAALRKNLTTGGAQEYNATIARIRTLKQLLNSLWQLAFEKVKEAYFRFFGDDGRRKAESN